MTDFATAYKYRNEPIKELWEFGGVQPCYCKKFGCKKILSLEEQLYSGYCFQHLITQQKRTIELKSLSQVFYYSIKT